MQTVAGVTFACLASVLFNAAVVLHAREARAVPPEQGLRFRCLSAWPAGDTWLMGIALQLLALGFKPQRFSSRRSRSFSPRMPLGFCCCCTSACGTSARE
jgi:hypothetical protein